MSRMTPTSSSSTFSGQAERRNVGPHQAAGLALLFEDGDFVAERAQVVGDGERRRSGADQRDAFAVLLRREASAADARSRPSRSAATRFRRQMATGLVFQSSAPASRLARPVAGAAQDRGKHIRFPVDHVRFGVLALRDEPDVLRNVGVRGTSPLAIHDFVEVIRVTDVVRFQNAPRSRTA